MEASRILVVVVLICALTGCAAMQPKEVALLQQSRYGEMEQYMEEQIKDMNAAPFQQLFYLCYGHSKVRRYNALFPCLEELDHRIEKGDYRLFYFDFRAAPSLMRSVAWTELGDYDKALEEAKAGYELTATKKAYKQMRIYALTQVGLVHALRNEKAEAERYASELEAVSTSYPHTLMTNDKYMGLAKIYMAMNDYDRALKAIERIIGASALNVFTDLITGASLAGESLFTFWELPKQYILNKCLLETGDLVSAKTGYDQLLKIPQTEQNGDIYWLILYDRGVISESEGDLEGARRFYEKAIEIIEEQRSSIGSESSKIGFVGDKQTVYHRLIRTLFSLNQLGPAFEYAERSKARALVDMLASRDRFAVRKGDVQVAEMTLTHLDQAEMEARVQGARITGASGGQKRGLMVQIKKELRKSFPELASLVTVTHFPIEDIQGMIPANEVLLEYYGSGDDLFAFILGQEGLRAVPLDGKGLASDVDHLRQAIADPRPDRYLSVSRKLYDRLIGPVKDLLRSENLLIVPHGVLHYLPFSALHSGSEYLIDRHAIRILPSASVLKFLKKPRNEVPSMLALGNPALGNPELDLKYAQTEATAVAEAWPKAQVLLREKATETAVKAFGGNFRILHFATHGKFRPEAPLESGLLLARDGQNDGILTVGELYSMKLHADLVTLSACETALGRVEMGDDVVGFTRAFLYAGAGSLVSSLWGVDDKATKELMVRFYDGLSNHSKRDALRQAQLETKRGNPHPFFWAPFILVGDWR